MVFCLACKKHTKDIDPVGYISKNNRPYALSKCDICKKMKTKLISVDQIKGSGFLSSIFKNIPVLNLIF